MKLNELLQVKKGTFAIIGSGGKTTMMYILAQELKKRGKVIVTTTTHIMRPEQFPLLDRVQHFSQDCVCMGKMNEQGKLSQPCPIELLEPLADYILVEADGSKRLPIKAHASHEPCIPDCANRTVLVIGASGFGKPIGEVVHRKERFCQLCCSSENEPVTADALSRVLRAEDLGDCIFVNQVENEYQREFVYSLKDKLKLPMFMGELKKENWICV